MKGGYGRIFAIALVAAFLVVALAPAVQAGHMTLYAQKTPDGQAVDQGLGETNEPDQGVMVAPVGSVLAGLTNRVNLNASEEPGDGSLFLDAQYYQAIGYSAAAYYSSLTDPVFEPVENGRQTMRPGTSGGFYAWFGWWQDKDNDGVITDTHDNYVSVLDGGRCPVTMTSEDCESVDEFLWKGAASGSNTGMALWLNPYSRSVGQDMTPMVSRLNPGSCAGSCFSAFMERQGDAPNAEFDDRTEGPEAQQGWYGGLGWTEFWTDESYLTTVHSLVVADAAESIAIETRFDLDDPKAYMDVDKYESVNGDVETLWQSNAADLKQTLIDTRPANLLAFLVEGYINPITRGGIPYITNTVSRELNNATRDFAEYPALVVSTVNEERRNLQPPYPKEPNAPGDDFPAVAFTSGGHVRGIGNDYSGHLGGFHLYADATTRVVVPFGANFWNPIIPLGVYGLAPGTEMSPSDTGERGQAPGFLTANVRLALWQDLNGDKWVGTVCSPTNDAQWDSAEQECRNPFRDDHSSPNGHIFGGPETVAVCRGSSVNGGAGTHGVLVSPVGGTWAEITGGTGVWTFKWYDRPTFNIWPGQQPVRYLGTETLSLELDACDSGDMITSAVDALLIPSGSMEGTIKTTVVARMTEDALHPETGAIFTPEEVTDVDFYPPTM